MRRAAPFASFLLAVLPSFASAQVDEERLQLMRESTSYTDVADAADGSDAFDVYFRVGFSQRRLTGTIRREITPSDPAAPGAAEAGSGIPTFEKIGDFEQIRNVLEVGADIGIYHDLALTVRLPVVLSDSYSIGGGTMTTVTSPDDGQRLFDAPFTGPTRSGLDTLHVGFAWAPLNQNRVHEVPSWVIMADAGIPIGAVMSPCGQDSAAGCDPGVTRGNLVLHLETRISRRHRYVEPYVGFGATAELATRTNYRFQPSGDLRGYQHSMPPIVGDLTVGAAFVPWENLPRFQRLVFDVRLNASYVSNGHDYSPLYDALGGSANTGLTSLSCEDGGPLDPNAATMDPGCTASQARIPFLGLTDVLAYGRFGGRVAVEVQAARYVLFSVGTNVSYQTAHAITSADVCNASVSAVDVRDSAVQCVSGVFNPHYRDAIDQPGRRFELAGSLLVDIFARITAQF